jgi:predicted ABC-type transport system involved in lysophospholipase L1 biosynthesis ATPase subunit
VTLLALTEVSKCIRDGAKEIVVLDRVSVAVEQGDVVGVHGERRAGKSTLLRIMAGIETPDEGSVCFEGQDVAKQSVDARARMWRSEGIALVRGDWRPTLSDQPVIEYVALPLTAGGITLAEAEAMARPVLERVGALAWAHLATDRLSLNERLRVELAHAMIREPRLLLVDEPAVLIEPSASRELYALLRSLAKESRMALVIASEDITPILGVDRAMSISDGQLHTTDSRKRVVAFPERRNWGSSSRAS